MLQPAWAAWSQINLPVWTRWVGVSLAPFSLALLLWVHITFDTNFSPTLRLKVQHQLILNDPYRYVRHPMYTALMLVAPSS